MIPGGTPSLLHERDQWAKSSDFTYTVINGAIGFSNVCQFPYEVYDNGGLVFVLVYAYLVVTLGVPLLYLEFFLGQFCGQSMPQAFGGFPMAKGLGWAMIYGGVLLVIVNTPPMAYTLIYLIECFSQRLPWKWCPGGVGGTHAVSAENYVSNVSCYEITQYQYPCVRVNSTLARRYGSGNYTGPEAVAVQEVTGGPAVVVPLTEYTALRNACIPGNISSQEYYWWYVRLKCPRKMPRRENQTKERDYIALLS
ncbi:sodium-dependent nutrient amino acid transporter 1-like [Haemaphysalis longicornis]